MSTFKATDDEQPEPFPSLSPSVSNDEDAKDTSQPVRTSAATNTRATSSSIGATQTNAGQARRTRGSSLLQSIVHSSPPLGMWQAVGEGTSKIPTLPEIKNGSYTTQGWSHEGQLESRNHNPHDIHMRRLSRSRPTSRSLQTGNERGMRATVTSAQGIDLRNLAVAEEVAPSWEVGHEEHEERSHHKLPHRSDTAPAVIKMHNTVRNNSKNPPAPLINTSSLQSAPSQTPTGPDESGTYPNGYRFPRKHTWTQSVAIAGAAFGKFFLTPVGFLITLYGLNVVGWGAMIFFVLIPGAAPAMCPYPYNKQGGISCNDKYSPKSKWIEYDSQILNALFCVTGFGLLPWRLRDFYYLTRWRIFKDYNGHRRLAGIYNGWYRLPGSDELPEHLGHPPAPKKKKKHIHFKGQEVVEEAPPAYTDEDMAALEANPAVPLPPWKMPEAPLTGIRCRPSKSWNLDVIIWMYILNSAFQVCLAGFMWGRNRFNRPSWATALFIVLGSLTGICAGIVVFKEGKKVKAAEGIPIKEYDVVESIEEYHERKAKEDKKQNKKHRMANRNREKAPGEAPSEEVATTEREVVKKK